MAQYRLPPPWSPNYALPRNVLDEGLERHAYVTAWMPRGSFDDPSVGDGGYALPAYVRAEKYGRGAYVTQWAPRGSYPGPVVPNWLNRQSARIVGTKRLGKGATAVAIQTMGAVEQQVSGRAAVTDYGRSLARNLIETVQGMPDDVRVKMIKAALDRIDPTLYKRAERLANEEAKTGVPALVALERGISYAASQGFAREIVTLGQGRSPAKRSQLGAVMELDTKSLPPQVGTCSADGMFIWDASGFWRGKKAGEQCLATSDVQGQARQGQSGAKAPPTSKSRQVKIGDFLFPIDAPSGAHVTWHRELPAEWQDDIIRALSQDCSPCIRTSMRPAGADNRLGALRDFIPGLPQSINHDFVGGYEKERPNKVADNPVIKFKHPVTGADWGLFLRLTAPNPTGSFSSSNRPFLQVIWKKIPDPGFWGTLWNYIKSAVATIVDFVEDAAKWVKDQGCKLLSGAAGPLVGAAAGAAAAGTMGIPPEKGAQAGAVGQQIVAGLCSGSSSAPPPPEEEPSKLPILLLGGAAVAAIVMLGKKKRAG